MTTPTTGPEYFERLEKLYVSPDRAIVSGQTIVAALRAAAAQARENAELRRMNAELLASLKDGIVARLLARAESAESKLAEAQAEVAKLKRQRFELAKQAPSEGRCACPQHGSWIAADDVKRLVREIDVALNGEAGAAKQAALCDVAAQIIDEARKRGAPLLAATLPAGNEQMMRIVTGIDRSNGRDESCVVERCGNVIVRVLYGKDAEEYFAAARQMAEALQYFVERDYMYICGEATHLHTLGVTREKVLSARSALAKWSAAEKEPDNATMPQAQD